MNNTVEAMSAKDMLKEISPLGRYAEGNYLCQCANCERKFIGDKRATQCLPCALGEMIVSMNFGPPDSEAERPAVDERGNVDAKEAFLRGVSLKVMDAHARAHGGTE